jgi:hypothetical protein
MTDSRVDEFNSMPRHPTFSPSYSPAMLTLLEVIRGLHDYDEEPVSFQEPTIYASEPWSPQSEAVVEWCPPKGGLPESAAQRRLVRIVEVRKAIVLLEDCYPQRSQRGEFEELANTLIQRVSVRGRSL